jgi:hypothetical protein
LTDKKDLRVTIRLLEDKAEVYEDFKKVCTEKLHSDICYVTTMLMESFTNAVNETPNADDPMTLHFLKQNVQINMGCNFNYYTKKARRNAPDKPEDVVTDTHNLLPNVVDDVPNLSEKARKFWFEELKAQGFIPKGANLDDPTTAATHTPSLPLEQKAQQHFSFLRRAWKYCKTFVTSKRQRKVKS